jgi:hypothetical protein
MSDKTVNTINGMISILTEKNRNDAPNSKSKSFRADNSLLFINCILKKNKSN